MKTLMLVVGIAMVVVGLAGVIVGACELNIPQGLFSGVVVVMGSVMSTAFSE